MRVETQAQADKLNSEGTFGPYLAANGHMMIAPIILPRNEWETYYPKPVAELEPAYRDYRVGDDIRIESWSAWCSDECLACAEGDPLPDW